MKLLDLGPEFCCGYDPITLGFGHTREIAEAQGIWFLCPACFVKNQGPIGTHMVLVWF